MLPAPEPHISEDGYRLWLRYSRPIVESAPTTREIIRRELEVASVDVAIEIRACERNSHGDDGFTIRRAGGGTTIIAATEIGALYGAFHLIRLVQTGAGEPQFNITQRPRYSRRILDHWDNLDGSIERGYAGKSLWQWDELPHRISPRYTDYARANASIGINGAVLNNVNASPLSLAFEYLRKTAAIADVFRPYGIRVYLSANFAAPKTLGGLPSADPLDPKVAAWWRDKCNEIYAIIPDFGGFVVKANSEGQPGPQDYGRTHADGANVLADALAPHGGLLMWRAFIYDENVDPDRAKRAYIEFTALDGEFRPNVMVQVKNGPIDFMPREPFHPLFGAMKKTPVMAELQITQEYLGHSNHLAFLAPMWKEFLVAETFAKGAGSPVANQLAGICGVANTGSDQNWCGHHFAQANWYAFGRLAWDPDLSPDQISGEWIRQTFGDDPRILETLKPMMLSSWETFINYTMPLGLHHLIGGDHYAVMPHNARDRREDWTATYYHRADASGIGFDRTPRGSDATSQYFPPLRNALSDPATCPEKFLLWFHHLPWWHRMSSGRTLWDELCFRYHDGARSAEAMCETWQSLQALIDPQRFREVAEKLAIQAKDASRWRDLCVNYFQQFSRLPIPRFYE